MGKSSAFQLSRHRKWWSASEAIEILFQVEKNILLSDETGPGANEKKAMMLNRAFKPNSTFRTSVGRIVAY